MTDHMKKFIFVFIFVLLSSVAAFADDDQVQGRPHWSLELKGGLFYPAIDNWKQFYGDDKTGQYGLAFGYKVFRMLELGIEGSYIKDDGQGYAPVHGIVTGSVTYQLIPINVFVLVRGIVSENQWVVPYIGGGYTFMYYQEKLELQGTVSGHADGYHGRAGLQFLLDVLDQSAANSFYIDVGVYHTYFFTEAQYSRAIANTPSGSVNLGGWSYIGGLLFEF
jgi:opacity protein-like surface antigen